MIMLARSVWLSGWWTLAWIQSWNLSLPSLPGTAVSLREERWAESPILLRKFLSNTECHQPHPQHHWGETLSTRPRTPTPPSVDPPLQTPQSTLPLRIIPQLRTSPTRWGDQQPTRALAVTMAVTSPALPRRRQQATVVIPLCSTTNPTWAGVLYPGETPNNFNMMISSSSQSYHHLSVVLTLTIIIVISS